MSMLKLCRCGKHIPLGEARCAECEAKHQEQTKERHREYKRYRTDIDTQKFYNSKQWKSVQLRVKTRDNGMCKLCWSNNRLKFMDTVHHIIELDECKGLGLVESNLISLCEHCHQLIHKEYKTDGKAAMQNKLRGLVGQTYVPGWGGGV